MTHGNPTDKNPQTNKSSSPMIHAEKVLDHVLDHLFDSVIMASTDGLITSFNRAATLTFGYTRAEALGQNVTLLMPEPHCTHHDQHIRHFLDWGGIIPSSQNRELVGKRKNGEVFPITLVLTSVEQSPGDWIFIAIVRDLTQVDAALQNLRFTAYSDPLTGLPNRLLLMDRLSQAIRSLNRESPGIALLFVDLDHFKPINDNFGHHVGDLVLRETATRLQSCVRESDTIARLGGDEFIVLLMGVENPLSALGIGEKIRETLNDPFILESVSPLTLSASIGMTFCQTHAIDAENLIRQADFAMYRAKAQGRNTVVSYTTAQDLR
ncbi:sensor domain-containing diguanylate cyclase [Ferrovum myxofaciens]|jgi:diguanylate cyclase (GGDEF)-like protein/PAS domain S-box-containing protein|nr:sensor domain-containing diguanylate cyclase [Ferrovum myxofaciens]NDU90387.1 diguanylate cyclase [Ferrovum sp.]MBU6995029.1 GGDEF domain-containing protein [Ferrovum myxofaciens]QKE38829.1 MAG: GGDEF domain-containing protein [Ferrovum myxofaciens]QKE41415.1 MAG: GGDEF domain-containing protein [Ferrovum myxofaciens]QWY74039.1 MAG: GGDEF domain-containing protein [Ferrovum myxofaciens]